MTPLKNGPWTQDIYETSATQQEQIGTLFIDRWGNKYHYAKAGATALAASKMTVSPADDADWVSEACPTAAVGDRNLTLTIVAYGSDVPENYFQGGQFILTDGTAEGMRYPITWSSAFEAADTTVNITLDVPLKVALTSATEFTLVKSPYMATVIQGTETDRPAGVPLVAVDANHYYWSQTSGEAICLGGAEAGAVGSMVSAATEDGAMEEINLSGNAEALTLPIYGFATGTTVVNGEYTPVKLTID